MKYRSTLLLKPRDGYYVPFLIMYDSSHFIINNVRPYNPSANACFTKKSYSLTFFPADIDNEIEI